MGLSQADASCFSQAKVNDRGVAAFAYNVMLRPGATLGLGLSLDTQNLNEAAHKVCTTSPMLKVKTDISRSELALFSTLR